MSKNIHEVFRKSISRVKSIALHPKQPVFITGNHCGMIYIWDLSFRMIIGSLNEHKGSVRCVCFHPSGELFASCGDDKIVRIWNYKTRSVVMRLKDGHRDFVRSVSFHPTEPLIVTGSDDNYVIVWNYYSGKIVSSVRAHTHYVMSVLFLDAFTIASASLDHTISIWKIHGKNGLDLHQTVNAHDRGINRLFFYKNYLISGSDDTDIRVWTYNKNILEMSRVIRVPEGNVTAVFYDGKHVLGACEDGTIVVSEDNKCMELKENSRVWDVVGRDGYILAGSDNGLSIYRDEGNMTGFLSGNKVYWTDGSMLCCYNIATGDNKKIVAVKDTVVRILETPFDEYVILEYKNSYDIVSPEGIVEGNSGQCVYSSHISNNILENDSNNISESDRTKNPIKSTINGSKKSRFRNRINNKINDHYKSKFNRNENSQYELRDKTLYKDGDIIIKGIQGRLFSTILGIFILEGNKVWHESGTISLSYRPITVVASKDEVAILGRNDISFYSHDMKLKMYVHENVEITSGSYANCFDGLLFFVYCTLRVVKYIYGESGIIQSLNTYVKILGVYNEDLYLIGAKGIECIPLNLTEIKFRKAVREGQDVLGFIEKHSLPGISPLNYLIRNGRGAEALPYIKDSAVRFDLFLSSNEFSKAFELCSNSDMYRKLAFKAMDLGDYNMAEKCFIEAANENDLLFFYMCTEQLDKIKGLENIMAGILTEDIALINKHMDFKLSTE